LTVLLAGLAAMAACNPSPDLSPEDFDTVVTVVSDTADFSGFSTYFLPDTVFQRPLDGTISRQFDDLIVSEINRNMQQLGYLYEPDPQGSPPDILVVASAITKAEYTAYLGWPYFGAGWGGQIVYPGVSMRYLYTVGTVTIDIVDAAGFDPAANELSVLWTASISGPLEQNADNKGTRITDGIDQAFAQSPYLKPDR
jgi:hypothetical protein